MLGGGIKWDLKNYLTEITYFSKQSSGLLILNTAMSGPLEILTHCKTNFLLTHIISKVNKYCVPVVYPMQRLHCDLKVSKTFHFKSHF